MNLNFERFLYIFYNFISLFISYFASLLYVRIAEPLAYASYSSSLSALAVCSVLMESGSRVAILKEFGNAPIWNDINSKKFHSYTATTFFWFALSILILTLFNAQIKYYLACTYLFAQNILQQTIILKRAYCSLSKFVIFDLLIKLIVAFALILPLLFDPKAYEITFVFGSIAGLVIWYLIRPRFVNVSIKFIRITFPINMYLDMLISISLRTQPYLMVLNGVPDLYIAFYSAAYKIVEGVMFVFSSLTTHSLLKSMPSTFNVQSIYKWSFVMIIAFVIGIILFLFSTDVVVLLYGDSYVESYNVLKYMSLSVPFIALNSVLIGVVYVNNLEKFLLAPYLVWCTLYLIACSLFLNSYYTYMMPLNIVLAELYFSIVCFFVIRGNLYAAK